jgi:SPP1 family predicted phage head-tail adaptor
MGIAAGRLRERVTIEAFAGVADGLGGQTDAWQRVATVWADVLPLAGREAMVAGAMTGIEPYRVELRRRAGLTPQHRLSWRGRQLNIRSVFDQAPDRTVVLAEAGVGT